MTSNTMVPSDSMKQTKSGDQKSERLYYLDWLRVLLIFGVFLFHVLSPFAPLQPWHIKNAEQSVAAMAIL
jgi:peptidoglycan/LPS O-acetylase OafA/YrhL